MILYFVNSATYLLQLSWKAHAVTDNTMCDHNTNINSNACF